MMMIMMITLTKVTNRPRPFQGMGDDEVVQEGRVLLPDLVLLLDHGLLVLVGIRHPDLEAEVGIRTSVKIQDRDCPEAYRFLRYGILSLAGRKGCTFSQSCS